MLRIATLALAVGLAAPAMAETTLRVMSYNIWGGGANEGKDIAETVAVLRAAGADIIGLQEVSTEGEICTAETCPPGTGDAGAAIAAAMGYHYIRQQGTNPALWANGILSRWPVAAVADNALGAAFDIDGQRVWLFNIHLDDEPYQPYQLMGIAYGPAPFISTAAEAVQFANQTRGPAMDLLMAAMAAADGAAAVLVTGDFNEPSALDWTDAAVAAGQKPVAVVWPTTQRLAAAGFVDAYRAVHPDPVLRPAYTWTPRYPEDAEDDTPDRIDFVLARGEVLTVTNAWIVGETGPRTDLAVDPWPSDHRAVLAEVRF